MELKDLENKVSRLKEETRRKYHLARGLGFSAQESQILAQRSEETIRRLANERNSKPG